MARNVIVIAPLAALNRGFFQNPTSSIGCSTRRSQAKKRQEQQPAGGEEREDRGAVQPAVGASITAYEERAEPGDRQGRADEVEAGRVGCPSSSGSGRCRASSPNHHDRDVHEEDRAPVEVLEEEPAGEGAERDADAGGRGPDPDGLRPLVEPGRRW